MNKRTINAEQINIVDKNGIPRLSLVGNGLRFMFKGEENKMKTIK